MTETDPERELETAEAKETSDFLSSISPELVTRDMNKCTNQELKRKPHQEENLQMMTAERSEKTETDRKRRSLSSNMCLYIYYIQTQHQRSNNGGFSC